MGGSAFTTGGRTLHTPRMPKSIYEHVKSKCHSILREHYTCVASPIEGPAKLDFGDIDILVAWPKEQAADTKAELEKIADLLDATDAILTEKKCSSNFAIPWPQELDGAGAEPETHQKHIQVDVRVCPTLDHLQWILFKHAHGDIWSILGSTIRPFGLTLDDEALWLRIPEVEAFNKTMAKIFLTVEPAEVLRFLGLPIDDIWDVPFSSLKDMFEYVTECRMFRVLPQHIGITQCEDLTVTTDDPRKLKSNDRRRMSKRPAFREWIDEFLPECRREGRFLERRTSRKEITREAIERFNVGDEYSSRRRKLLLERQRDFIFRDVIKGAIPQPDHLDSRAMLFRGCQVKALKRIILEGDKSFGVQPEESLTDEDGLFNMKRVAKFIAKHKNEVGKAAIQLHQQRYDVLKAREADKP
ncbi:hypothetical protein QQS21_002963 [Conoideocrella luteorostrata]|uniref:Nucleotidyltransferase n=1 Tax=Conoideocrella luteorostrata TaxID=1105319 RepID=A0AAJ0CU59_9HYPO|nr:hypothetical protein QQS21_002963 [Conoideocrella luteorostrata]